MPELVEGLGPTESIPMAARNDFLKKNGEAVGALPANYAAALQWSSSRPIAKRSWTLRRRFSRRPGNLEFFATDR